MKSILIDLCGWLPAIIIPLATIIQLKAILQNRSTAGISAITWFLFGVANVGLYIYTEKYQDIQAIAGLLGSALLDFVITGLVITQYGKDNPEQPDQPDQAAWNQGDTQAKSTPSTWRQI